MSHSAPSSWRPATICIHSGYRASHASPGVVAPIERSTTFLMDDEGYRARAEGRSSDVVTYAREASPNQRVVEERLAALDGAERALVFSSGMAALHCLFMGMLAQGDRLVVSKSLYGGTTGLLRELMPRIGVEVLQADFGDPSDVRAVASGARMLFCEGVSNPDLQVADLPGVAEVARDIGAKFAVDATFTSPAGQRPIEHGADLVMHSASKYLGGHSDLIGGVLCGSRGDLERAVQWRTRAGGCMDPQAAYLLDRGLRTLLLRVRAQSENAVAVGRWLEEHPRVERVLQPGLASHPQYARANELLDHPGGMLSFVLRGGDVAVLAFMKRLKLILEAPSLGGVETMVSSPGNMSHVRLSPEERLAAGVPPGLVRVTLGIEDKRDLIEDLEQALAE